MREDLRRRLLRAIIFALGAAALREHDTMVAAARREDMGYDDCPVCRAARS